MNEGIAWLLKWTWFQAAEGLRAAFVSTASILLQTLREIDGRIMETLSLISGAEVESPLG